MNSATTSLRRPLKRVMQLTSHKRLSKDASGLSLRLTGGRLDAIIVPASRPASFLQPVINMTACLGVTLVVLCSKQTRVDHVAKRVASTPRARSLIITIPEGWEHAAFPHRTADAAFDVAKANRASDLSLKRNLALLLARLRGWNKIAFLDDDITLSQTDNITRLAGQLDAHQVAGMVVEKHPDNSVVCHARRLAGMRQDVFVTGAVLGVHCNSLPLSFFPDIYNEDWFFFAKEAAARMLPRVGTARQLVYDPFASPDRARQEEFGDLLAEGLYALFGEAGSGMSFNEQLSGATTVYWERFIQARRDVLTETRTELGHLACQDPGNDSISSAYYALGAAESQLDSVTADLCLNFLEAWQEDLGEWQHFSSGVNNVGSVLQAMDFLELKDWALVEFGDSQWTREAAQVSSPSPASV
jgi:hypothetical protein